ncbi:MAG: hypothetical protein GY751_07610 [Bacteroidetes bacterium]|nr:hypothetical protein [Bacteroidota bacterium]
MSLKNSLIAALVICAGLISSCGTDDIPNPIPDLNPDTPGGGDMLIFSIDDLITWQNYRDPNAPTDPQLNNINRTYDFNGDGNIDLSLISKTIPGTFFFNPDQYSVEIRFIGQILRTNYVNDFYNEDTPVYLPAEGLIGGSVEGRWTPEGNPIEFIREYILELTPPYYTNVTCPAGLSYIPTRTNIGGEWFYGWIEILASDYGDLDWDEFVYISRFGISQTPGLRIRMGQE